MALLKNGQVPSESGNRYVCFVDHEIKCVEVRLEKEQLTRHWVKWPVLEQTPGKRRPGGTEGSSRGGVSVAVTLPKKNPCQHSSPTGLPSALPQVIPLPASHWLFLTRQVF